MTVHHHRPYVISLLFASALVAGSAFGYSRMAEKEVLIEPLPLQIPLPMAAAAEVPDAVPAVPETRPRGTFGSPIARARERVLKKPFGMYITPETSPVENDRFTGYHVGVDFETFASEQDADVPVFAICDGPVLLKTMAKGYGGLLVQECDLADRKVQIIYGHVLLESVTAIAGQELQAGERIASLGRGYTEETDGARKHLHLGIHDGERINVRGYVKEQGDETDWLDAMNYIAP
jgi:hypothetical protein